jgi:hypothetical protein
MNPLIFHWYNLTGLRSCLKRALSHLRSVVERGFLRGDPSNSPFSNSLLKLFEEDIVSPTTCGRRGFLRSGSLKLPLFKQPLTWSPAGVKARDEEMKGKGNGKPQKAEAPVCC